MEFFTIDAYVDANHTIRLSLFSTGDAYLPASTSSVVTVPEGPGSTLQLDIIDPADKLWFDPPPCTHSACLDWLNQTANLT